jgi:hypothetical protein
MVVTMKINVFWDVMLCGLVGHYQYLQEICCFHHQAGRVIMAKAVYLELWKFYIISNFGFWILTVSHIQPVQCFVIYCNCHLQGESEALKTVHDVAVSGWKCTSTACLYESWLASYNVDCYSGCCVCTLHEVKNTLQAWTHEGHLNHTIGVFFFLHIKR